MQDENSGEQPIFQHCEQCGETVTVKLVLREAGQHYADRRCINCDRFLGFEPKPDSERKNRPSAARNLVHKHGHGYCQMCLRWEGELPKGQALEGHHVIPHSEREAVAFGFAEAGDDSEKNTWVICTACHRLVDWRRDYRDVRTVEAEG